MKHVSEFPREIVEHPDMGIEMADGCRLSARVWMPKDAVDKPVPAILEHIPYRKRDGTIVRDQYTHPWFAGHGYACIRTDMRGNGDSQGLMDDEYLAQELQDACDVIAWAAQQPWCNGNVGMMGISWGGFNALQVAALQPPALKAIITLCSTVDRYADDIHYKGGCLLTENFGWATNMLSYSSRPPDAALVGEKWRDMWMHRLENLPFNWSDWMRHQKRDAYWKHGSVCEDYGAIKAAVLSIGGWHDGYRNTISHLVENLDAPVKGIVGPWNHKYPHYAGPKPAIGFLQEAKRWWDRWLKGQDTGVEDDPAYRVYLMDCVAPARWFDERPGHWIAEHKWPSSSMGRLVLHLGDEGALVPQERDAIRVEVETQLDCGREGGEYFPFAFGDELPAEQGHDDERSACFDSTVVADDVDIVGPVEVHLKLKCDRPNGQVVIRLCDLYPDGRSAFITYAPLNLTHRQSHETPAPVIPDQAFDIAVKLDQIAYRLPRGHRLRLAISTSYWPLIWPSAEQVSVTLLGGRVEIPQRPFSEGGEWEFAEPEAAPAWRKKELRPARYVKKTDVEPTTGHVRTRIRSDFGQNLDLEHGLISGSWATKDYSIHPDDPLSGVSAIEWEQVGGREGQMWRTHVTARMRCDSTHFFVTAKVSAFENDALVFERTYDDKVRRDLV